MIQHNPNDLDPLEPSLDSAVRAVLSQPVPAESVERLKFRAKQLPSTGTAPRHAPEMPRRRIKRFSRAAAWIAATALAAAVVAGAMFWLDRPGSRAFAQVVEKVNAARTVQFKMTSRFGSNPEFGGRMLLRDQQLRVEQFNGKLVHVADLRRKQALYLDTDQKLAQKARLDQKLAEGFANPIEQLRTAESKQAEVIGEEDLDGRRTRIYQLKNGRLLGLQADKMLVWVDAQSQLPVKITFHLGSKGEVRFDHFVWNESLDDALFSLDIPSGYREEAWVVVPKHDQPEPAAPASLDAPNVSRDGILSRDRVPSHIVWNPSGTTITALLREPETERGGKAHELRQWDVATGKLLWSRPVSGAGSLAMSTDGKSLATAIDYEIQVLYAASGNVIRKWEGDALLPPVAFSPDGTCLAAAIAVWAPGGAEKSGGVQIWDTGRGGLLRSLSDEKPTTFVQYSADGKYVASASNGGPVKLWDPSTGDLARVFPGFRPAFSPDGRWIACIHMEAKADKNTLATLKIYDLQTTELVKTLTRKEATPKSWLLSVEFSPDGRFLAAADWDGTVTVWETSRGELKHEIREHKGGVLTAAFSPDGTILATGSEDKTLRLWKLPVDLLAPATAKP